MPRKTLFLLIGLIAVTIVLFSIALRTGQQPQKGVPTQKAKPTAHTILLMSPESIEVVSNTSETVSVDIDTSDNPVTAVQLEISYDPLMLSNVKITPGSLVQNATILLDKNDTKTGRITYAFGVQPNKKTVSGKGSIAIITFTAKGTVGDSSEIILLPETLVTARGVADSVLKQASGAVISITE